MKVDAQKDPLAAKADLFARPPGHHLFSPHHRPPDLPPSMQSSLFPHGKPGNMIITWVLHVTFSLLFVLRCVLLVVVGRSGKTEFSIAVGRSGKTEM